MSLLKNFIFVLVFSSLLGAQTRAAETPQIIIDGADELLRNNIRSHLRIGGESCDVGMGRLLRLQNQVRDNTQQALNALGYYKSAIQISFSENESCWSLLINVVPGEAVIISEANIFIEGEAMPVFDSIVEESTIVAGQQLNHGTYERLKNDLSTAAVENGFFSARFTRSSVNVDLTENSAVIDLVFNPGPRYYIGDISINNNSILTDDFVRSLFQIKPGDSYANGDLIRLRNNLDQSQYFSQVSIRPQLSETENLTVPLVIDLQNRPRHEYSAGIGFTTDTGPRVRLGYENRYQTRNGHRVDGDISLSEIRQQVNGSYTMPLSRNPLRESLQFSTGYIFENNDTFDSKRLELKTTYRNESVNGWLRNTFINYQRDDYEVNLQSDVSSLSIVGFNLSKTTADNLINPSRGWNFFAELSGASDALISDTSFVQTVINGKYILPAGRRGRFMFGFNSGFTWIDDEQELPVSLRFLTGGDQTLRGYKYQSLGPLNVVGEVVGGKHLLNGSLEYDYVLRQNWRAAVFYDNGNAFNEFDDIDIKQSVGFGLRWLSPIGPLRVDLAFPTDDDGFRFHVTMGPDL
jgi:translocation and assembly module TamA